MKPVRTAPLGPQWRLVNLPGSPTAQAHVSQHHTPTTTKPGRHNPNVPDITLPDAPRMTSWSEFQFVQADAHHDNNPPAPVPFDIRGKIGQTVYQATFNAYPTNHCPGPKILQRRRMHVPQDPRTPAQLKVRARFGRAVQLWNTLTADERRRYDARGHAHNPWLEGLNLWIREYARTHELTEFEDDAEYLRDNGHLPPLAP